MGDLSAGCSAVAWETADGGHLWGRNFDFNRIAADSKVTFVPRGQVFYACGTELEGNLEPSTRCTAAYAAVGIGSLVLRSTPALYEGLNEKGLMGGQLYYRTFAHFAPEARPGTLPLQPPFLVTWCLATCASVEEVARALEERVSLVAIPMLGDRAAHPLDVFRPHRGEHRGGVRPGRAAHLPEHGWSDDQQPRLPVAPYQSVELSPTPAPGLRRAGLGRGAAGALLFRQRAAGLPGGLVVPLPLRAAGLPPGARGQGRGRSGGGVPSVPPAPQRRLSSGCGGAHRPGEITPHDRGVVPYDYTVYSSVLCAESMRFYWLTYRNSRVRYVELSRLLKGDRPLQFALGRSRSSAT